MFQATSFWGSTRAGKEERLLEEKPEPQRKILGRKNWRNYFLKVVKIVNSEENPEDEEPDCICSGVNLRVKDKNDVVSRHLKIFMELCMLPLGLKHENTKVAK